ncbi:ferredoxin-thioredoxin variable chain-like [Micractinium conductrix]|uniref:Ferredoxin-thioredoxin variable chain-like n=1 Tax=Micractinium conductrix TaxID=554055 RepID=A0A2P6VBT5_9CHLO|nr:ferredoxin-thioredoxin variable chain-like [Micractinium conductrix]|eukprot:PSC71521.1 ferredoxin-thioredoxin variable chain-like [Micractinium conductrix]
MQSATALCKPFAPASGARLAARHAGRRAAAAAAGNGAQAQLAEGAKVKVTAPITVFHSPKYKTGLDLQNREGVVVQPDVNDYRHHDGKQHTLSANLPIKVQFEVPPPSGEGKVVKVVAHLAEEEIEAV